MSDDGILDLNENTLIILSARCDKNKELNSLRKVGANQNTVIDIQLESLKIKFNKKYVVLGEKAEIWYKNDFKKIINEDWFKTKSGYSLSLAIQEINPQGEVWILYSDIIFRDIEISKRLENKNLVYIDNEWETRFSNRKKNFSRS